jgi:transcriptional regulator with XRE-family HTH domain
VVSSLQDMPASNDAPPKKAKPRKVSLDADLGPAWSAQRKKRGYSADELGRLVGVSNGTVSNVELGKQKSLPGPTFLRWRRLLFGPTEFTNAFEQVSDVTQDMTDEQLVELVEFAAIIKKRKRR